jgi:rhodanese-related sulfurtransferase
VSSYQISPLEVKEKREEGESFILLDVREPSEYQAAHIDGSLLIPLGQLSTRMNELDPDKEIITLCHHGIRSQTALGLLVRAGFKNVKNLTGGIDAYSVTADPTIPRYR